MERFDLVVIGSGRAGVVLTRSATFMHRVAIVSGVIGSLAVAAQAVASEPAAWSPAPFEQSRLADRPVLLVVADPSCAPCQAAAAAAQADQGVADRVAREFVLVHADAIARPDLADELGLAVRELGGGSGFPLVVALTPDVHPYLGRAGLDAFEPAAFDRFATEAAAGFRLARSGLDARAAAVLETLRAAQTPSPPVRPLGPDAVDSAVRAVVGWSELGRPDGPLPHAALRLLLAEHERARRPELLKLVTATLDLRLARPSGDAASTAEEALRLGTWTRAFASAGTASYRAEAARSADRLLAARDAQGLFPARADDPVLVAQTNGLAIAALALSSRTLGREPDRDAAVRAAGALDGRFGPPTALARLAGGAAGSAFLDDYAALLEGLLELYETTDDPRWRAAAQAMGDAAIGRFLDPSAGGSFLTDGAHEPLPVRLKHAFDGALPSANGTLSCVLPRLSRATGEPRYADLARRTVEAFLGDLQRAPRGLMTLAEGAGSVLGRAPQAAGADWAAPARETRGGVTLEARAPRSVRAGEAFDLSLALSVAPGTFVVARSGGAIDLASLGVSVPFDGARQVQPRYPEPRERRFPWSADPVAVYEGSATVPVRVTLPRDVQPSERQVRVRVLFQACTAARCEKPESLTLETGVRIDPAR